jgi:hypothetical protein
MKNACQFPHPQSHNTFNFEHIVIDSKFDSGNLINADRIAHNNVFYVQISLIFGYVPTIPRINIELGSIFQLRESRMDK